MPKVSYTKTKGLHQESGNGVLLLGETGTHLGLGQRRSICATISGAALESSYSPALAADDVLFQLPDLNVETMTGITATKIFIEKIAVNVTTVSGTALAAKVVLSNTDGTAADSPADIDTEVFGAGCTYVSGQLSTAGTEVDLNLASQTLQFAHPNISSAIANKHVYLVSETSLTGDATGLRANVMIDYYVL